MDFYQVIAEPKHVIMVQQLWQEYANSLEFQLMSLSVDLKTFPKPYAPPTGCQLLVVEDNKAVGCVSLKRVNSSIAEMKRLYVCPSYRGKKIGRKLIEMIVDIAKDLGYQTLQLDTVPPYMDRAMTIYQAFGFKVTDSYQTFHVPLPIVQMQYKLEK